MSLFCPLFADFAPEDLASAADSLTSPITALVQKLHLDEVFSQNDFNAWLTLLASIAVGVVVGWSIGWILGQFGSRCLKHDWRGRAQLFFAMMGPANLAIVAIGLGVGLANLKMPADLLQFVKGCLQLLGAIAVFWYAYNLVDVVEIAVRRFSRHGDNRLNHLVVLLMSRSLRVFLLVVGTLYVAQSIFHQDIGAWLAGLGIAGLAVSLAAQDSLKNLFGSVTIVLDHSFRIGDRIVSSGFDGTVEDIGFRSTKIRTSGGHLVTIPNSNLINGVIENVSRRPAQRRVVTLLINSSTSFEKVQQLLRAIGAIFAEESIAGPVCQKSHGIEKSPQVRLEDITNAGFRITTNYWHSSSAGSDFTAHAEAVNLRIVETMQAVGVEWASG